MNEEKNEISILNPHFYVSNMPLSKNIHLLTFIKPSKNIRFIVDL